MSISRKSRFGPRPSVHVAPTDEGAADPVSSAAAPALSGALKEVEVGISKQLAEQGSSLGDLGGKINELRTLHEQDTKKLLKSISQVKHLVDKPSIVPAVKAGSAREEADSESVLIAVRGSLDILAKEFSRVATELNAERSRVHAEQQASELVEIRNELTAARQELAHLTRRLFAIQDDNQWLELELQEKYRELSMMAQMLRSESVVELSAKDVSVSEPESLSKVSPSKPSPPSGWSLGRVLKRGLGAETKLKRTGDKLKVQAKLVADSGLFDARWYSDKYLTNIEDRAAPVEHYLVVGAKERFDPGASFCTGWYLDRYPDVAASGMNPLLHYIQHGMAEGREPLPR